MFKFIFVFIFFLLPLEINSKESLLTLKQQLDRLQREVSDLSKSVFKSSRNELSPDNESKNQISNLTAFDLRIYDLEKDIKTLNANFEEIIFQIDDLKNLYEELLLIKSSNILGQEENLFIENNKNTIDSLKDQEKINEIKVKNSLGSLIIKSEDLKNPNNKEKLTIDNQKNQITKEVNQTKDTLKLSPEEEFQKAFDMIRNQKFSEAKIGLQDFIKKYKDNILVGSAHYWLGEIYLLKKEYREAALILAEGYQKFPLSLKAPDMLLKLSDSLFLINKKKDGCGALKKRINEFPNHKLATKAKNKSETMNCINLIE